MPKNRHKEDDVTEEPKPLRELRTERMLTVRGLARIAGVSPVTVLNVELRRFRPTNCTMQALSEALGCEVGEVAEFREALAHRGKTYRVAA